MVPWIKTFCLLRQSKDCVTLNSLIVEVPLFFFFCQGVAKQLQSAILQRNCCFCFCIFIFHHSVSTFYHNLITSWWPQNNQSIFASPRCCLGVWYLSEGLAWDNELRDSCTPALQCGDANLWLLIRWCGRWCPRRNGRCRFHLRSRIRCWKIYHHRCSHCGRSGRVGLADRDQRCTSPSCCTHCRTSCWITLIQAGSWKAVWCGFTRRRAVTCHPDLNVVEFLLMGSRLRGYSSLLLLGNRQTMWMRGLLHSIGWKQVMVTNHNILHSKQQCTKYWNILTSRQKVLQLGNNFHTLHTYFCFWSK